MTILTTITEKKRFSFKRMSPTHVKGYNIMYKEKGSSDLALLAYVENPQEAHLVETLQTDVVVKEGYISMPNDAYLDYKYPPIVLINNLPLGERDYSYSAYLKCIRLSGHVVIEEGDDVNLIYHRDLVVHEEEIIHDAGDIKLYDFKIEPVYHNTHLVGYHNIIE